MKNEIWLKKLGYLDSSFRATQSTSNQISHLLVGALSGMFNSAVSLRVSIAFYSSILLEVPAGLIADKFGHFKSVALGSFFTALALLFLFFSLSTFSSSDMQFSLLVTSSLFSALGMTLISGAYQAMLQDVIDRNIIEYKADVSLRTKALLLSQKYGKEIVSLVPVLFLFILLLVYRTYGHAEFLLMVPALLFTFFGMWIWHLGNKKNEKQILNPLGNSLNSKSNTFKLFFEHVKSLSKTQIIMLIKISLIIILLNFSMVHVHTYLMVSEFREYNIMSVDASHLIPLFIFISSFDIAHYVKGIIVPRAAARFNDSKMIFLSFSSLFILSSTCYYYMNVNSLLSLIFYVLFFRAFVTMGQDVAISNLLARIPEEIRAFTLSLIMSVVIILYGAYSIYLTFSGLGTESSSNVILEILVISSIGLILALSLKISPISEPAVQEIKSTN
ncbi:hypothetical protein PUG46_06755 [Erwiniaceae bacterium L1_55_4]|nr:hypothetical protein [Erwiniaceae bacterium L1_55_4]